MISSKDNSLEYSGIKGSKNISWNLPVSELIKESILAKQGELTASGAFACSTGEFTARSPKDNYIVADSQTEKTVWWAEVNQKLSPLSFERIYQKVTSYLSNQDLYVKDLSACADKNYKLNIRLVTEYAWQGIFAHNLFLRPQAEELVNFKEEWLILSAPGFVADPKADGLRSKNFTVINFSKKIILIGGTAYPGEIKKAVFTVLNFILPQERNVLPMQCSANVGKNGDTAIFFGLSGTGKTTLSADPARRLIGDDEHGWDANSIFNLEGGNSNTRATYPIDFIKNAVEPALGKPPENIFFLTTDAFGVLPPVSKLNARQAMYHFISGYSSKITGTKTGDTEPQITFSACFGELALPLHPVRYASMLGEKLKSASINVWLINTGWTGGSYGKGERIKLAYTRAMITAILNGELAHVAFQKHKVFELELPLSCPGVPAALLNPENTWTDKNEYLVKAENLADEFARNFRQYKEH